MKRLAFFVVLLHGLFLGIVLHRLFLGIEPAAAHLMLPLKSQLIVQVENANKPGAPDNSSKDPKQSELQPFDEVVKKTEKSEGLFTLYRDQGKGHNIPGNPAGAAE